MKFSKEKFILLFSTTLCLVIWGILINPFQKKITCEFSGDVLKVYFFDVGQGDSSLIISPTSKTILIDAGPIEGVMIEESDTGTMVSKFSAADDVLIPFLKQNGIDKIDYAIITHPHSDHYGGFLKLIDEVKIMCFLDIGYPYPSPHYENLLFKISEKNIDYRLIRAGDVINVDDNLTLKFFHPDDEIIPKGEVFFVEERVVNDASAVAKLTFKNFSILFTGDIEFTAEMILTSKYSHELKCNILKVPHHGSITSSTEPFLDIVRPELAVISCGVDNPYGHPHDATLAKFDARNIRTYITARDGTIPVVTDGYSYKVLTYALAR